MLEKTDPFTVGLAGISSQTEAEREIRSRIAAEGRIPFIEFMRLALYHPDGYYARHSRIGARGDYFTSPAAHPAFGALIAVQLEAMWRSLGRPRPFWAVEAGAGDGVLAADVLAFCDTQLPELRQSLRYLAIDRSPQPAARGAASSIRASAIPLSGVIGCILSNELLDAFPVHRFRIARGRPAEIYVSLDEDGTFAETLGPPSAAALRHALDSLPPGLPDGFQGEFSPDLRRWIASASNALSRGYVLTIDYGGEAQDLYTPRRSGGTLQTHYRHTAGGSPYQRIGRQDITAHVNFTALVEDGRRAGLRPIFLTTQAEFLASLGFGRMEESIMAADIDRRAKTASLRSMRLLTQPRGLGGFRVLVQDRNTGITSSSRIVPSSEAASGVAAPMQDTERLPAFGSPHS